MWCKLEFLNPSGSSKDRIARYILEHALQDAELHAGDLVIEASSVSTSIAVALACAQMGLRFTAVMPEGVGNGRTLMIRAFGGRIHMIRAAGGIRGALSESERLAGELGAFLPRQFSNIRNPEAHQFGTVPEIRAILPSVDAAVSGVGAAGTPVGLFNGCPGAIPVYARPIDDIVSDPECCSFGARIPGVVECVFEIFREDRMPGLVTIEVRAADAIATTRRIIAAGYPVGPSSGLNYCAAAWSRKPMWSLSFPTAWNAISTSRSFAAYERRRTEPRCRPNRSVAPSAMLSQNSSGIALHDQPPINDPAWRSHSRRRNPLRIVTPVHGGLPR